MNSELEQVVDFLKALREEQDIGKKFKEKTDKVISILSSNVPLAMDKALLELEELNALDISPYYRTQIWDAISMLESIKNNDWVFSLCKK